MTPILYTAMLWQSKLASAAQARPSHGPRAGLFVAVRKPGATALAHVGLRLLVATLFK